MKVVELKREMDGQFANVERQFANVERQFADVRREMDEQFSGVQRQFADVRREIAEDGQRTRRYMDVLYEKFKSEVRLSLEQSTSTAHDLDRHQAINAAEHVGFVSVLDDHEVRLRSRDTS